MRILHIITQKPYATGSGVYLSGIIAQLGKRHQQYLICGLNDEEEKDLPTSNIPLIIDPVIFERAMLNFPVPGMSDVMPYRNSRYGQLTMQQADQLMVAFLDKVKLAVTSFQPDVILCQHLYLVTATLTLKLRSQGIVGADVPILGICHGSEIRQFKTTDRWRDLIRSGIGQLDGIISTHQEQAAEIVQLFGVSPHRIRILGSGFNQEIFKLNPRMSKLDPPLKIVFTGKLSNAKGVPELLKACDLLAKDHLIHLTLIGSGADPLEFEAIKAAAGNKPYPVVLTGQLNQTDISRIYQQSHLFILPSYYEGMPLVVPEALACGMGVVVTDLPGFSTWLGPFIDRVGLIEPPEMIDLNEPSEVSRQKFIGDIAKTAEELLGRMDNTKVPDLSAMTWQGLSLRIEEFMKDLKTNQRDDLSLV